MTTVPIFDGHNDTLINIYLPQRGGGRTFLQRSEQGHIDFPRAKAGGMTGGIFAIFVPAPETENEDANDPLDDLFTPNHALNEYSFPLSDAMEQGYAETCTSEVVDLLYRLEAEADGAIGVVRSWSDVQHNFQNDILSMVLHFEDAVAIKPDLSNLETYYQRGLRSLGLVWSRPNAFGCGVPYRFPHSPDTGPGLTEAGRQLVQACNQMGIVIDLAHINEQGFWDVARLSDAPLVVSHTAVHALCASTRNLTDAQIDAVGQSNGVIGVIFTPICIRQDGQFEQDTPLADIVRHIDYIAERIGVDHVAFGSDFDGAGMPYELKDATALPNLIEALRNSGYSDDALNKIAYANWWRVLRETWAG